MRAASYSRGFTLIEILTVVFIVGMLVGGVTVFITGDGPEARMRKALERFVVICDHISELSILSGEPIGLVLEPPAWRENPLDDGWRYSWMQRKTVNGAPVWQDLAEVPAVDLEKQIQMQVFIDDLEWKYKEVPKTRAPLFVFYPSGEISPFEILFTHEDLPGESQTITVDLWGRVVWKERQEEEEERKLREAF